MIVYVLLERHDYEGQNLIGVFSSEELARDVINRFMAQEDYNGDNLSIYRIQVDSAPFTSFEAEPCYDQRNEKRDARVKAYFDGIGYL